MNIAKCKCKGNIFIPLTLNGFHEVCHSGEEKKLGRCIKCNKQSFVKLRRRLGPEIIDEEHIAWLRKWLKTH
jgi:hypothetical protein